MWKHFIDFSLSNFASFNLSLLRPVFEKAIKILSHQKKMYTPDHPKHFHFEYRALMVSFTAAVVEHQAGYHERALAIFQLLLEFNLCRPSSLSKTTPTATSLDLLQTYWESEVPRLGEVGSEGWGKWHEMTQSAV
eukprot:TRINITY_DN6155_c0_g1_i1.p1 TRINITY_DN6155_c0_g1~~TRINITY_DN6155_c0_g1_i1.p1  ORF type:complete len:145 (-),score=31.14 TRINITY_DN6155_c0_g1_i1:276-680(-)